MRNDPRIAQTDKDRGQISAAGQKFNAITSSHQRPSVWKTTTWTIKQPISIDTIQAVQLSNYGRDPAGLYRRRINQPTSSSVCVYRDSNMAGAFRQYTSPSETTFGFTLGGPIIKDLFFFANYEKLETPRNAPTFGRPAAR